MRDKTILSRVLLVLGSAGIVSVSGLSQARKVTRPFPWE